MMAVSADIDMDNEYNMDDFVSTVNTVNIDDETITFNKFNPRDLFDYLNRAPFKYVVVTVLLLQFTFAF